SARVVDKGGQREIIRVLPGVGDFDFRVSLLLPFDKRGGGQIDRTQRAVYSLFDTGKTWRIEVDVAERKPNAVGKLVNDAVVVHGGAAGRFVFEEIDSTRSEGAKWRGARRPHHEVDDVTGLLDDVVARPGTVEIP